MGVVRRLVDGLAMIGVGNAIPLVRYTAEKKRLDREYLARRPCAGGQPFPGLWPAPEEGAGGWAGPGSAAEAVPTERGLRVGFGSGSRGSGGEGPGSGGEVDLSLSFLESDLLEVNWKDPIAGLPLPGLGLPEREWPAVTVDLAEGPQGWTLRTAALEARLGRDGRLSLRDPGGRLLREELPPLFSGSQVCHRVRLAAGERIHGLGERTAPVDLRGGAYHLWNRDPGGAYGPGEDPVYLCIPVYLSRSGPPGGAYLAFYANSHAGLVDVGKTDPGIIEHRFAGGGLRYYLASGRVGRALERFTELTGKPPLPPLWALGYHQCRWSYYPEARVRKLAADFVRHQVPVDAIHLDIHYMDGYRVFTVDRRRFPDLGALAGDLAAQGIRLVVNIDPGVKKDPDYRVFREGLERGVFATLPDGRVAIAPVWPGPSAFPDFSRSEAREWWGSQLQPLLEVGVAGLWQDMNEPAAFVSGGDPTLPLGTRHAVGDHLAAHNLYGLFMSQATDEGLRRLDPEHRPFIVSRSGWAGLQRHSWTWTADVRSDWACLKQTMATVIGLGLSGIPFSGSDVGGFNGRATAELYVRWLQMSAFMPFFRSHTMLHTPDQEPWSYGEPYTSIAREFIRLRYSLLPYIYTLAWEANRTGAPLVRPLWWGARGDAGSPDEDAGADDAFLVGASLLVAPVAEKGATSREVPVPAGFWYDFWTGAAVTGPARVKVEAPLDRLPLFVRAGTVLPMEEPAPSTTARSMSRLLLHLYVPPSRGAGLGALVPGGGVSGNNEEIPSRLFSDAGDGYGPGRVDTFRLRRDGGKLILDWDPDRRPEAYAWPYGQVTAVLHGLGSGVSSTLEQTPATAGPGVTIGGPGCSAVLSIE